MNINESNQVLHERYQHLGGRAFWIFFFQKSRYFFGLGLGLTILMIIVTKVPIDDEFVDLFNVSFSILVGLFILVFIAVAITALFQYMSIMYMFDENALKIRSGIINIHIEAIPYRQIQNIHVERDVLYRLFGVSRIIIQTAGEDDGNISERSEGVIPAIEKKLADRLQHDLMQRSNIERISDIHHVESSSGDSSTPFGNNLT